MCNKQYVRKEEIAFNIRLNNHRKDVRDPNATLEWNDFQAVRHSFNKYVKFIIIDKWGTNVCSAKDVLRERLIQRQNLRIQKLKWVIKDLALLFHVCSY